MFSSGPGCSSGVGWYREFTHLNLNDDSIEGIRNEEQPAFPCSITRKQLPVRMTAGIYLMNLLNQLPTGSIANLYHPVVYNKDYHSTDGLFPV
jgi:hypothetical protein